MATINRKRITVKPSFCPNPLFEKWIEEWRDEAASRDSDLKYCFDKALKSLRKYPVRLESGKQCLILKNFGTHLCQRLDKKLSEYRKTTAEPSNSTNAPIVPSNPSKKTNKRKKDNQERKSDESSSSSPRKKKPYIPELRSGPYAVLITLYREQLKTNYCGYMKKKEIQEKAQELCDSSFLKPDPGSYYTAWSSVSNLIKKSLIHKQGNPAKFSLTKEGEELAKKLFCEMNSSSEDMISNSNPVKSPSAHLDKYYAIYLSDDECIDDPLPVSFPYSSERMDRLSPIEKLYPSVLSDSKTESNVELRIPPNIKNHKNCKSPKRKVYPTAISSSEDESEKVEANIDLVDLTDENIDSNSASSRDLPNWITNKTDSDSQDLVNPISSYSSCSALSEDEQYIFLPGEFEVILLVDTQETKGGCRNTLSDDTVKELTEMGTKFEVRHLKVGDFLWIGRHHNGKELVLPFVVERKRMDDLGGSIKDGRFHEQKFRLRQCGLQNVIYLVEKYGTETRLGLPISTLYQAAMNTQIVDNFHVKFTNNHYQSMMYLSVMTTLLTKTFKDKTLISCLKNNLPPLDMKDDMVSLITFEEFTKISAKNKTLKIREMFIKHLLQLKGLSVDKALAITELYPTPRKLISAFLKSDKPEFLLAGIQCGSLNRNIGPALSKVVYQLYCSKSFL